ncbi:P-loop NTPase fold protein [uncultured Christiangramia sp.]|uniref:KAP family P-loop NTPase fold protein n=1 Tax=uncultured Christiangramia sp. TaxID=503836 RepID=UPI00260EEBC5|nr:P-loop NTPase fold protein [uncultured Christiangramia sp.]
MADIFENDVNNYQKKKIGITTFKKSLAKFIADTNEGKPIIFIIDELDRCRPNYAVSILEQIKHFFSVPNIVFVLSIDKKQLGNAIRGVYGSDRINSDEYLRRFIDVEYSIPKPPNDLFYKYLIDKLNFDEFFQSPERSKYRELIDDKERFLNTCKLLFNNSEVVLRQQERILILSRLSLRTYTFNNYVYPSVYLVLIFIKTLKDEFYHKIVNKKLSFTDLQNELFDLLSDSVTDRNRREIMFIEVYFLMFYNNYKYEHHEKRELYERGESFDDKDKKLLIHSMFGKEYDPEFLSTISHIERANYNSSSFSLEHIIRKIDLLDTLKA